MKKILKKIFCGPAVVMFAVFLSGVGIGISVSSPCCEAYTISRVVYKHMPLSGWDALKMAIALQESDCDSLAKNGDYWGILQIGSDYVSACNRILGCEHYKHEDAYKPELAFEMFELIQNAYNPHHDIDYAIKLHNPGAGMLYKDKIMKKYRRITKYSEIMSRL